MSQRSLKVLERRLPWLRFRFPSVGSTKERLSSKGILCQVTQLTVVTSMTQVVLPSYCMALPRLIESNLNPCSKYNQVSRIKSDTHLFAGIKISISTWLKRKMKSEVFKIIRKSLFAVTLITN